MFVFFFFFFIVFSPMCIHMTDLFLDSHPKDFCRVCTEIWLQRNLSMGSKPKQVTVNLWISRVSTLYYSCSVPLTLLQQVFTDMGIFREVCGLKRRVVSHHGYDKSIVVYITYVVRNQWYTLIVSSLDLPMLEVIVHAWEINCKINREPRIHCARATFCPIPVYMLWTEKIEKKRKKSRTVSVTRVIQGFQYCTYRPVVPAGFKFRWVY